MRRFLFVGTEGSGSNFCPAFFPEFNRIKMVAEVQKARMNVPLNTQKIQQPRTDIVSLKNPAMI